MEIIESDWIGLAPEHLTDPDDILAFVQHVEAVEEKVQERRRDRYLGFSCRRANQVVLRHYFNRALHHPDADAILLEVLGVAYGKTVIWETHGARVAYVLLAVLTSPACAHIPIESYPTLARSILAEARQYRCTDQATQVGLTLKLAADLAASTKGGESYGGATCGTRPADDLDAPSGR